MVENKQKGSNRIYVRKMIVGYTILPGMCLEEFSKNRRLHLDGAFGVMRNIKPRVECGLTG
jgi:hypothetical protein